MIKVICLGGVKPFPRTTTLSEKVSLEINNLFDKFIEWIVMSIGVPVLEVMFFFKKKVVPITVGDICVWLFTVAIPAVAILLFVWAYSWAIFIAFEFFF